MEQHRAQQPTKRAVQKVMLSALLEKNRSTRGYDASFVVRKDQLRRIVAVNSKVASARNRQPLRFRLVVSDEAPKVLPHIKMGSALANLNLPLRGQEPNAFIVVCSTIEPRPSTYIDLGISVQSMLLQAVEIGLNGLCIMSFDKEAVAKNLNLKYEPLLVVAIGKSVERFRLVGVDVSGSCDYYREKGVHCVPKLSVDELIIE